ncbi:MAG: VCBS repeat-containing protein [Desulfuromonadaceae bacterium]|nr:VCBS repeat-containing protein [Desulfuromonadaceae bacterium]
MKLFITALAALVLFTTIPVRANAGPLKINVAEFNVSGVPNNDSLKQTLQGILTSRLSPDLVQLVEKPDQAEILVIGSYAQFGKMFSMDVLIKDKGNSSLTKVFEQGEGQEDVLPAIGRLARKIDTELAKRTVTTTSPSPSPAASQIPGQNNYTVRDTTPAQGAADSWSSAPLNGVFSSIAMGRTHSSGERELFVAGEQTIRAYLKGSELRLVAEITIPASGKILAIDTADLDRDGSPELYVTIIDREAASSRVYQFNGTAFVMIAEKLPWFFRGIGNEVTSRTIYAQEIENGVSYYGDVKELTKSNARFTAINPLRLPRTANIFNFNRLSGVKGKNNVVVLNEDGYLVIYSPEGSEVWKSSEKFGGSESFFKSEIRTHARSTRDLDRWMFLEQRIMLLKEGTVIVPRNEGTLSFGNIRAFDKYALFAFDWTGAVLKEKWHTRLSPGYLADYAVDQTSREVLLLEVVKKPGLFDKRTTVISINKID